MNYPDGVDPELLDEVVGRISSELGEVVDDPVIGRVIPGLDHLPPVGATSLVRKPEPYRSRVHELARLNTLDLRARFLMLAAEAGKVPYGGGDIGLAVADWDRDQLITGIRDIEDPLRLAMRPLDG